jgi:hypothetical protein
LGEVGQAKPDRSGGEPFKGAEAQQIDKFYLGDIYYCSMPSPAYHQMPSAYFEASAYSGFDLAQPATGLVLFGRIALMLSPANSSQ